MSLVTLKKKTQAKYNNNSVNMRQFSLNGSYRNQGYVGQDTLGRSLPRTLAKGNTLRGSGGCCGKFKIGNSVISGVTSTEDNSVVKPSVISNDGMIATHYRWIGRPQPFTVVKPDNNIDNKTGQDYIDYLRKSTIKKVNSIDYDIANTNIICNSRCNALPYGVGGSLYKNLGTTITKPVTSYMTQSYSEYLLNLGNACVNDYANCVANKNSNNPPKPSQGIPLPIK